MLQTRMSYIVWWIVVLVLYLGASVTAYAHSPYLDQQGLRTWIGEDGRRYQIGMLYGDGIFGPDPGRAVVLNDHAQIVAVGPRSDDGYVYCYSESSCLVILSQFPFTKAVPTSTEFRSGRTSDFYPEFEKETYGFEHRWLNPVEYFVALTVPFRRDAGLAYMVAAGSVLITFVLLHFTRLIERFAKKARHKSLASALVLLLRLAFAFFMLLWLLSLAVASSNGFYWVHPIFFAAVTFIFVTRRFDRHAAGAVSELGSK